MARRAADGFFVAPQDAMNEHSPVRRRILIPPPLTELFLVHADESDRAIAKFLRHIGAFTPEDFRRFTKQSDLAVYFAAVRFVYLHRGELEHLTSIERVYRRHLPRILAEIDMHLDGFLHCASAHDVPFTIRALFPFAAELCGKDHPDFRLHRSQRSISALVSNPRFQVTGRSRLGPRFESYMDAVFSDESHEHHAHVLAEIERHLGRGYLIDVDAHLELKRAILRAGGLKSPDFLHFGERVCALDLKATLEHASFEQIDRQNTARLVVSCGESLEPILRMAA